MIRNLFTVDVEEYFCVSAFEKIISPSHWDSFPSRIEANIEYLLDALSRNQATATFFVLGWVAERNPGLVRRIAAGGHEIASHGYSHKRVHSLPRMEFEEDVRRSKAVLEQITGAEVKGFRAPSFSVTKETIWALEVLVEQGFQYDSSIFPIYRSAYGIPDAARTIRKMHLSNGHFIYEVPLSCLGSDRFRIPIGGGAYLRWFPFRFTEWGLRRINNKDGIPFVGYIHPWELDPQHPPVEGIGWVTKQRHFRGIKGNRRKVEILLKNFSFESIIEHIARNFP